MRAGEKGELVTWDVKHLNINIYLAFGVVVEMSLKKTRSFLLSSFLKNLGKQGVPALLDWA